MIKNRKQAAKNPFSFDSTTGAYILATSNSKHDVKFEKPFNSSVGAYVLSKQRTSSLEDQAKQLITTIGHSHYDSKAHKRNTQDGHKAHMTMDNSLTKWEYAESSPPNVKSLAKYSKENINSVIGL